MGNPILVALDLPGPEKALELARSVSGAVGGYKIGSELFTTAGPEIVRELKRHEGRIFLDLKFHDIPNTVAKSVAAATRLGVDFLTVHCLGGLEMLQAAEAAAQETALRAGLNAPVVLGVTVLTSMNAAELERIGCATHLGSQVERLAGLAVEAGLRGLVCSPLEVAALRQILPASTILVTPGIRSSNDALGDQKRVLSAREAMEAGASWLVVGRPIYGAADPKAAALQILQSLESE